MIKIFKLQDNNLIMNEIKKFSVVVTECCISTFNNLSEDYLSLCEKTKESYADWRDERINRITGSVCYLLYTYFSNKNANWSSKYKSVYSLKNVKSVYTEYGKKTEPEARQVFIDSTKKIVVETGLIVSSTNPWLAYSSDGIILQDGK